MFKSKTVFVIGAGCSKELGFPLGNELKDHIASLVGIYFEGGLHLRSGDSHIVKVLDQRARELKRNANDYYGAGRIIARALPLAISIDNFLEAHSNNEDLVYCGKLGIARAILQSERGSPIYLKRSHEKMDFFSTANTWLAQLSRYLTEGVTLERIDAVFDNVTFIIFNYDRSVETFLWHALQSYYNIPAARAEEILLKAKFHHPYGTVGRLAWQSGDAHMAEYGDDSLHNLSFIAEGIRTFSEEIDSAARNEMLRALGSARVLVFLGFSFIAQNMRLLELSNRGEARRIFATALGLSSSDCEVIKSQLSNYFIREEFKAELRNNLTATELFSEYSKSITQYLD